MTNKLEELHSQDRLIPDARIEETVDESDTESSASSSSSGEEQGDATTGSKTSRPLNRNEKKARKSLLKLGLKPISSVKRITLRRGKAHVFAINDAEVFQNPADKSYVVFGTCQMENNGLGPLASGQGFGNMAGKMPSFPAPGGQDEEGNASEEKKVAIIEEDGVAKEEGSEEALPEGLDEKDVKIVMEQAKVSRSRAIAELVKQNNDIVNTIMELTM
jgi:nascent polypeptide-associated complex subunit alpha